MKADFYLLKQPFTAILIALSLCLLVVPISSNATHTKDKKKKGVISKLSPTRHFKKNRRITKAELDKPANLEKTIAKIMFHINDLIEVKKLSSLYDLHDCGQKAGHYDEHWMWVFNDFLERNLDALNSEEQKLFEKFQDVLLNTGDFGGFDYP